MSKHLHHVVMSSHSADALIKFFTEVVGMEIQHQFPVPGHVFETTLGWPPSDGATITSLGEGMAGLVEVLDVPEAVRSVQPEGLTALSFLTEDYKDTEAKARRFADDVTALDAGVPGVDLFVCTVGGVPMEFMGSYAADAAQAASEQGA
jgi:catechol 2,3-dioxygenase-like lactoylglutathione lyase family enzyme